MTPWSQIIQALLDDAGSAAELARRLDVVPSSIPGWLGGTEPTQRRQAELLAAWSRATGRACQAAMVLDAQRGWDCVVYVEEA